MRTGGTSLLSSPQWLYNCVFRRSYTLWFLPLIKRKNHISSPGDFPPRQEDWQLHSLSKTKSFRTSGSSLVEIIVSFLVRISYPLLHLFFRDQALGLLVSVSCTHCCASTPDLSTLSSARGLTTLRYGISYLEVSFTLRCFQRLSRPHFATRPCRWRDNRCTIGASTPVLSY